MKKMEMTNYREGSIRSFVEWTPALLRSAQLMADGGSMRLAADLCEALLGDSRVQGVLNTRVLGLLGLPLHFTPADDSREAQGATKTLEADFWKAFPEADLAQLATWGVLLGVGVGEIIWETQGERALPRLKVWHPRWLRWDWEKRQWLLAVDGGNEITIEPGSNKWVLYTPSGSYRPWSHGAWRACAQPWLMKQLAIQDWARHSEVHGSPIRVGTAPEGASAEVRQQVAHDFQRLGSDTAICLPAGFDLRFAEASGGSWQMFKAELDWANTELAIALAGQNLTSEVSGGSYAAASVHQAIRQDLIEADARTLSTCLREQVVRWWAEYNLGRAELAPWPEWETEAPQSVQGTAQALGAIAQAVGALKQIGVEVDSRALLERTGVAVVGGEATTLSQEPVMLFDPAQARDWHGRWTRYLEGEGGNLGGGSLESANRPFSEEELREPKEPWKRRYLVDEKDVREEFELSPQESHEKRVAKKRKLLELSRDLGLEPKRDGPLYQPEVMTQDEHEQRLEKVLKALYLDGVHLQAKERVMRWGYDKHEGTVPVRERMLQRAKRIRDLKDELRKRDQSQKGSGTSNGRLSGSNGDPESRQYDKDRDTILNPPPATGNELKEMKKIRDENLR